MSVALTKPLQMVWRDLSNISTSAPLMRSTHLIFYIAVPKAIKIVMLNSTEHDMYPADKCQKANNCWHFLHLLAGYTGIQHLIVFAGKLFIFQHLSFNKHIKVHAQLS